MAAQPRPETLEASHKALLPPTPVYYLFDEMGLVQASALRRCRACMRLKMADLGAPTCTKLETEVPENTMTTPPKHQGSIDTEMTDGLHVAGAEPATVRATVEPGPPRCDFSHAAQLSAAQERINELQRQLRNEKELQQQAAADLAELRKAARENASALNRIMRRNQGRKQLQDSDLIQMVKDLRREIRDFTLRHFQDDGIAVHSKSLKRMNDYLVFSEENLEALARSPSLRPGLLQLFIWIVLVKAVHKRCVWAPQKAGDAFSYLRELLGRSLAEGETETVPEGKTRYHMWRANTANLVLNAVRLGRNPDDPHDLPAPFSQHLAEDIEAWARPLTKSASGAVQHELVNIVQQFVDLDEGISEQVASLSWSFQSPICRFESASMEPQPGQPSLTDTQDGALVVAPALIKCGKSSGDDFDVTSALLKMQCLKIEVKIEGRNSKPPAHSSHISR
ncbi:hypothetical protein NEMBOFW57_004222 [Staphylotrichum longicolle]|uniref:Uncharacterized protein n=1 Tax=Staphylotrichum longicolle TaxID=669026 RepID=A0AAD4I087_9PEZI|nr:hypothetical protein NEMBOFW57_004222 [Staphylotrichum longicolle]